MNISIDWLNQYLDRPTDAAEAERVLTEAGFPVEGIEPAGDDDRMLDVEVTSNRPDCLSHVGIAREMAAATSRRLLPPETELPAGSGGAVEEHASVENRDHALCPQYTARVVRGVKVGPSPRWLRARLEAIGLRPVNNVVDATNFVLHETGQPLHAFDLHKLAGQRIVVRTAERGETITAIDGSHHELSEKMLVIADADKPVAIAGVMGGAETEVTEQTADILLESARFDPLSVRGTGRSLKLASDSSYRFERGVDPEGVDRASRRAARLIVELAGGELCDGVVETGDPIPPHHTVQLRPQRCHDLLGLEVPTNLLYQILDHLALEPEVGAGHLISCTIPGHRLDLHREADLIEEVARLHGYHRIPVEEKTPIVARPPQQEVEARKAVGRVLVAHGYHEAITFSFLPPEQAEPFAGDWQLVHVDEEKKKAEPALRPSLLPSLLACRKSNQDAGNRDVKLFEAAEVFGRSGGDYAERSRLALLADAERPAEALRALRGTLEELLEAMGLAGRTRIDEAAQPPGWAQAAAEVFDTETETRIGTYGVASEKLTDRFDLQTGLVLAELDYPMLTAAYPPQPEVRPLPTQPAIERDLSVIVDEPTQWRRIEQTIRQTEPALLERIEFVTTYRGKPVPKGRKSVTFRLRFRDPQRTLQHDEATEQVNQVVAALSDQLGAELRG